MTVIGVSIGNAGEQLYALGFVMSWLSNGNSALAAILAGLAAFSSYALFRLATARSHRQRTAASLKLGIALAVGLAAVLAVEVRTMTG